MMAYLGSRRARSKHSWTKWKAMPSWQMPAMMEYSMWHDMTCQPLQEDALDTAYTQTSKARERVCTVPSLIKLEYTYIPTYNRRVQVWFYCSLLLPSIIKRARERLFSLSPFSSNNNTRGRWTTGWMLDCSLWLKPLACPAPPHVQKMS